MGQLQIDDVIAHFKEIIAKGEKVTVYDGVAPIAEISPLAVEPIRDPELDAALVRCDFDESVDQNKPRPVGMDRGTVIIHPSFFDPLPDETLAYFEGRSEERENRKK